MEGLKTIEEMWQDSLKKLKNVPLDPTSREYTEKRLTFYTGVAEMYVSMTVDIPALSDDGAEAGLVDYNKQIGDFFAEVGKLYDKEHPVHVGD